MGRFVSRVLCTTFLATFIGGTLGGALFSGGCDNHPPKMDMAEGMEDMSTPKPDMATPPNPDLSTPPADMAKIPDMSGGGDMAGTPDLAGPKDMSGMPVDMSGMPVDMSGMPVDMSGMPADMSGMPRDMSGMPVDMTGMPVDMATGADMGMPMTGGIGDPCTDDTGCKVGPAPKCWKANVLNNTANPPTAGGYCSAACTADAQCGSGNRCVNLGMAGSYCLAGCNNATTCRHPGYACSYYDTAGICFPDTRLDCDPKAAMGACTEAGTGKAGGCLRQAYENKGVCQASCTIGTGTCAALGGVNRQCIYLDASKTTAMDNWKGAICIQSPATPTNPGDPCTFLNECKDGYQCDNASSTCQQLCVKGGMPACAMGVCADAFMTPATGPGICR